MDRPRRLDGDVPRHARPPGHHPGTSKPRLTTCRHADCADRPAFSLSTGQRQRLSLAMALLRPSLVLLLDEPERGLDAAFRERLAGLLAEYAAEGGTVVMVTHDPRFADGARSLALAAAAGRTGTPSC
ncbi:ABC transporter ATP-binding protein [Actinomadura sp. 7K507]|uniref:ABC transporter ATP-binding protein n=1 Tax=Actinomadura sp. 7K507 TaxID=2530365 RepID=UPI002442E5B2|nr:ABC transporter ATP-binding protein [Actinomadura sp. 7K507]